MTSPRFRTSATDVSLDWSRFAWLSDAAAIVFTVVLRYWVTRDRTVYLATPDEASHLAIARTVSGARPFHMLGISFDAGYGTLLAPVYRFVEDPELAFRTILIANVLVAGITLLVVRSIVVRVLGLQPSVAIWCAAIAVALPGAALQTLYAGSEGLVALVVASVILLALRLEDARRPWVAGLSLAVVGAATALVHSRLLAVVGVVFVILVASAIVGELPRLVAAVSAGVLVVLTWAARAYNSAVHDEVWVAGSPRSTHRLDEFLERFELQEVLASAGGMIWHQMVATFGLALVGAGYLVATSVRRDSGLQVGAEERRRWKVMVVLAAGGVPAAIWIADRILAGQMVYGRYWAPLAVPVTAIGVGWLIRAGRENASRALAGSILVTAVFSLFFHLGRQDAITAAFEERGFRSPRRILGLLSFVGVNDPLNIVGITAKALAVVACILAVLLLLRRHHRLVTIVVFVGVALAATVRGSLHMDDAGGLHAARWEPAMDLVADGVLPEDSTVAFQLDAGLYKAIGPKHPFAAYQFYQPDVEFIGIKGRGVLDYRWVVSDSTDRLLEAEGWEIIYTHPDGRGLAIWEDPARRGSG